LALPPDTAESFVREVDDNLRQDQMRDMAKRYGKWIVAALILFLAAVGGWLYWQNRLQQRAIDDSEAMSKALDTIGEGNVKAGDEALKPVTESPVVATRASALLGRAAMALQQNDRKTASAIYGQVAADDDFPQPFRDLATVRAVSIDYDTMKPDEVIARLAPLSKPGNAFFGTAGEMTGMALLAKGDKAGAARLFAQIAADKQVPESIRSRAVQVAGSLGVDATASMPGYSATLPLAQ
jgi:hypothetical protein